MTAVFPLTWTRIEKEVALTTGMVENVYVAPEFEDSNVETDAGAEVLKSPENPVVRPATLATVMEQKIADPTRSGTVLGVQLSIDAEVG